MTPDFGWDTHVFFTRTSENSWLAHVRTDDYIMTMQPQEFADTIYLYADDNNPYLTTKVLERLATDHGAKL